MYEVQVVYLYNGEAIASEKTYYPPLVDDVIELAGIDPKHPKTWVVIKRTWKQTFTTTNEAMDVELEPCE